MDQEGMGSSELETVINCFKTTGVLPQNWGNEEDPFTNLDEDDTSLEELVQQIDPGTTTEQYLAADDDLSTCLSFEHTENCREDLRSMVCEEIPLRSKQAHVVEERDDEDDDDNAKIEQSSITSYEMALHVSNDLQYFFTQNQEEEIARNMLM